MTAATSYPRWSKDGVEFLFLQSGPLPIYCASFYRPQGVQNENFDSTARAHEPARRGFAESGGGDVFKPGHQPTVSWNRAKRVETTQPIYRVVQWGNRGCQSLGDYAPVFAGGLQHVAAGFPAFRQHWTGSGLTDLCGRHWRQYRACAG